MSILIGPTIQTNLIALNKLLNKQGIRENEDAEIVSLTLRDDGVLCLYRGSVAGTSGLEFRVARSAITSLEIERDDESLAFLLINTNANAVSKMLFMPVSSIEGDHGYSGGECSRFGVAVLPEDSQQALGMLQVIITTPGAQWFAELPELWKS